MIAVDTNVLVRLLINDPDSPAQVGLVVGRNKPVAALAKTGISGKTVPEVAGNAYSR